MTKSENIKNLIIALHKFQAEAKPVVKDSTNPFYKSRYADLSAIIEATQEGLSKNGLAISQTTDIENGVNVLETTLFHISGEWITGRYVLTPNKPNDPQAMGSALSYARRYNISSILNLATTDDDGEKAMVRSQPEQTNSEQMLARLGEIKNIFELKNWWTKHEAEIKSLPAELKAQVVKTKEKIKLKLEGKTEKDVPLNPRREPGEEG